VASSKIKIFGSRIKARAIASRCFWPVESLIPRSPTNCSYFLGNFSMKLSALAAFAASIIS